MSTLLTSFAHQRNRFKVPLLQIEEEKTFIALAQLVNYQFLENEDFDGHGSLKISADQPGVTETVVRGLKRMIELTGFDAKVRRRNGTWVLSVTS